MFTALPSVSAAMIAAANANSLLSPPSRDRFDPRPSGDIGGSCLGGVDLSGTGEAAGEGAQGS